MDFRLGKVQKSRSKSMDSRLGQVEQTRSRSLDFRLGKVEQTRSKSMDFRLRQVEQTRSKSMDPRLGQVYSITNACQITHNRGERNLILKNQVLYAVNRGVLLMIVFKKLDIGISLEIRQSYWNKHRRLSIDMLRCT